MEGKFSHLLSPFQIGKLTIKNRMVVAPMGDGYLGLNGPRGEFSEQGIEFMVERAQGGFGLMITGCQFTDNKIEKGDPISSILDNQGPFIHQGQELTERAAAYGMKVFGQITMGLGRNYPNLLSSSENEVFEFPQKTSQALTVEQIKAKIGCVIEGAKLMQAAGFAGVEVHALHWGYLLDQFSMSITNKRTDEYGGSLENRLRPCKEIVEGIKAACGADYPVSIRLGAKSFIQALNKADLHGKHEAGRTLEESVEVAKLLEAYGYDVLNVDTGMYDSFYYACAPSYMPYGYCIDLAAALKKAVNIPIICGSSMNDPDMNEEAVAQGKIDAVALGRQALADSHFVKKLEMGTPEKIRPCIGCLVGCLNKLQIGAPVTCAVNPASRRELTYHLEKTINPKKVMVIGGGVAGMEAARTAKMRGHQVEIFERGKRLGGVLHAAGAHDYKPAYRRLLAWYENEIKDRNIPVYLGEEMTPAKIIQKKPDVVILAVGGEPLMPRIDGIDSKKCISAEVMLEKEIDPGQRVVVVGGGLVGCETAIDLAQRGKNVTIVEASPAILAASRSVPISYRQMIPDMIEYLGIEVKENCRIEAVNDRGAVVLDTEKNEKLEIEADTVVISIGRKPRASIEQDLYGHGIAVYSCGDMNGVGLVYTCVTAAYEIARHI